MSPAAGLPLGGNSGESLEEIAKDMPREEVDKLNLDIDDQGELVHNQDGSADLVLDEQTQEQRFTDFDANLAEHIDETEMQDIAQDLMRKIDVDKKAREKRDQQYEEGLRRTGMGDDAPGGANFKGASRAVHPMLTEACVDFCAASIKELLPPGGPAKSKIEGVQNDRKYAVAQRQQRYLNWQLTEQMSEFPEELEQLLTQLPMGGSQYLKFWRDHTLKRSVCEFVPIDDLYLPFACSDFYTAQRITHVQRLTQLVFEERVESGFYRNITEVPTSQAPDQSKAATANDKIEGRGETQENIDGERLVYEVNTFLKLSVDGGERLPYLVSIDETSRKIVSIYRNWDKDDETQTRLDWIVEFGFIAWRGAYKIGMPHLIGGLSAAATGALRAILDSAHFNNLPGYLRLKGARVGGQNKEINPAQGVEVEGSAAIDDIRKLVLALPYNPPSPVLFQLLGWLTEAAKGVVTTAEERIKDASNQMPVGTALALIEQGAKVFSSIHARLHRSMSRSFKILARLNRKHLSVGEQIHTLGEVLATRNDFGEPLAVIPVSDPNVFSEAQRFAQMQMVLQLAQGMDPKTGAPTATAKLHNLYEAVKRLYEIAKIPNFERFLPPPPKPEDRNAAAENAASMMNQPLMAFPHQDHLAHIETHMRFITDPFLGGSGMAAHTTMPMMMEHVKQHLAFLYMDLLARVVERATGQKVEEIMKDRGANKQLDRIIAIGSKVVHSRLQERLAPLGQVIMGVLQQIAKMQQPPPMDPSQAVLQAKKMEQEGRAAETDKKLRADMQKKAIDAQQKERHHQDKVALEREKLDHTKTDDEFDNELDAAELELRAQIEGEKLSQGERNEERRIAHESMEREADREEGRESRFEQAIDKERDREFQSGESEREREIRMAEHETNLEHEREGREHQAAVQRESEERHIKASEKSEKRKLEAAERQAKAKARESNGSKPSSKKKK